MTDPATEEWARLRRADEALLELTATLAATRQALATAKAGNERLTKELAELQTAFEDTHADWQATAKRLREAATEREHQRILLDEVIADRMHLREGIRQVRARNDGLTAQLDAALLEVERLRAGGAS